MAKLYTKNNNVTLESSLTKKAYENAKKFCPKALALFDDKDEQIFSIGLAPEGAAGNMSNYGVVFNGVSRTNTLTFDYMLQGLAEVEIPEAKQKLAEDHLQIIVNLDKVEQQVTAALAAVQDTVDSLYNSITVE